MTPINAPEDVLCTAELQDETKTITSLTLTLTTDRVYKIQGQQSRTNLTATTQQTIQRMCKFD